MEGRRNGGDLGLWSRYRDHTTRGGSLLSSSSSGYTSAGTIVSISTGYTSNSSRLSSISSLGLEAAIHLDNLDEDSSRPAKKSRKGTETSQDKQEKEMDEIKILIQEFIDAQLPSPACSLKAKGGNIGILDWWLKHLGVGWVLHIVDDYVSAGKLELTFHHARSWIRALAKISETIHSMLSLCPGGHGHNSVSLPSSSTGKEQQPEAKTGNKHSIPDLFQFAQFIQETMLKLLVFVDVIVEDVRNQRAHNAVLVDLSALLSVYDALSVALLEIRWQHGSRPSGGVERIQEKIHRILSAKQTKAAEAILSTMKQILMEFTKDPDNLPCSLDTQTSSDVHKVTLFAVTYIRLLCSHCSVATILSEAASHGKYVPQTGNIRPFHSMVREIVSCLQETLTNISESFLDLGLSFLFLVNNFYFIRQELPNNTHCYLQENMADLFGKVGRYVNSYLEVSWAPMLSSLLNPTPLCFKRSYSPLPKFEDEFRKTYITQKLWKVPDPKLRTTLHKAIIEKIIPDYTNYIEENKTSTPNFSPDELTEMLQRLFEG